MNNKNKRMGPTPITSRIKKTTKGGMTTQPLLNMGAPVKMRRTTTPLNTDPAKAFKDAHSAQETAKADSAAANKAMMDAKNKAGYAKDMVSYRSNVLSLSKDIKKASENRSRAWINFDKRRADKKTESISSFEKNLYDRDMKNNLGSVGGYTPKEYAMARASGTYKRKTKTEDEPIIKKDEPIIKKDEVVTKKKELYTKKGGKATGSMKDYKIGSQARRDEYTSRGWAQDSTTKVRKATTGDKKSAKVEIVSRLGNVATKAKPTKLTKPTKVVAKSPKARRLINKGVKKTGKAAEKQAQADKALAAGNTRKAARKQKAADRKSRKADKKFRQADGAIDPR